MQRQFALLENSEAPNKAHGWDDISIRMIEFFERLIFNSVFNYFRQDKLFLVNFVLFQETPVLLNYYKLPMKFTKVLILAQREKLKGFPRYFKSF